MFSKEAPPGPSVHKSQSEEGLPRDQMNPTRVYSPYTLKWERTVGCMTPTLGCIWVLRVLPPGGILLLEAAELLLSVDEASLHAAESRWDCDCNRAVRDPQRHGEVL